jgi:hypothetical protein
MKHTPISELTRITGYFTEEFMKSPVYPCHMTARFTWRLSETVHLVLNLAYDTETEFFSIIIAIAETEAIFLSLKVKTENYRDGFHQFVSDILKDILNKYR